MAIKYKFTVKSKVHYDIVLKSHNSLKMYTIYHQKIPFILPGFQININNTFDTNTQHRCYQLLK